jgi:hypothetical protein
MQHTLLQPLTLPSIYGYSGWTLPITYYSKYDKSEVILTISQAEINNDNRSEQSTKISNQIRAKLNWQRIENGFNVYEYVLDSSIYSVINMMKGTIVETTTTQEKLVTPIYLSVIPDPLNQLITTQYGNKEVKNTVIEMLSGTWLQSSKKMFDYEYDANGNLVAKFGISDCFKIYKFMTSDGCLLPSDSFVKLSKVFDDDSYETIDHLKVLTTNSDGTEKITGYKVDSKQVTYIKIDESSMAVGRYVIQGFYTLNETVYKTKAVMFEI